MSEPTTDYLHDVTITSPSVDGMRTVVTLDGMPVKGVMAVTLEIAVNKPNRLRLEMAVNGVNADATAQEALTTEPMAAIARQAAIGAAMERLAALPDVGSWEVSRGIRAKVWVRAERRGSVLTAEKPTIEEAVAAIAAALDPKP